MEVIWHQHIGNQLAGPLLIECLELGEKSYAASRLGKDWQPVDAVAGDIVECAWQVEVRPFAGHVKMFLELFGGIEAAVRQSSTSILILMMERTLGFSVLPTAFSRFERAG